MNTHLPRTDSKGEHVLVNMRTITGVVLALSVIGGVGAWAHARAKPPNHVAVPRSVGTHPGGVGPGKVLTSFVPDLGDSLVGFSAGCFWGSEQAFRKVPGVVATAVGYEGGTSEFPTYSEAHETGHAETVLVEFNPKVTPLSKLLATFWTLHRATDSDAPYNEKSPYRAAIWTYNAQELKEALASRTALQAKEHRKFRTRIQPAQPFYLAEEYHQQYDEKSGTDSCPLPQN